MGNTNRDSLPPPQTATINSPAFQTWLTNRQSGSVAPVPASEGRNSASGFSSGYGAGYGSGSGFGSGSGGGGYGLALISADEASQERIKKIMRDICEKEGQK